jgi:hypothetical protein
MKAPIAILLLVLLHFFVQAQSQQLPLLERKVSINMQNMPIEKVLTEVAKQAEITFSYNPDAVGASITVSVHFESQSVRFVLNHLFGGEVDYRQKGKFLILQQKKQSKNNKPSVIEGYLLDAQGAGLADATVYSSSLQAAVNTDEFGYLRIEVDAKDTALEVRFSKKGFEDALLMPVAGRNTFVNLSLPEDNAVRLMPADTVSKPDVLPSRFLSRELLKATENITETFQRTIQFSLFPHVGTNLLFSGTTSNLFSFNLFAGYVQSVKVLELGGFMNMVRYDAGIFQGAGFANYVGRNTTGFQGAGFANHVGGNVFGFQGAGFMNHVRGNTTGFQGAGFSNLTQKDHEGFQGAGFVNHTGGNMTGVQGAGFANHVKGEMNGFQGAGFLNRTGKDMLGVQAAGAINLVLHIKGAQLSGTGYMAASVMGVQATGVLNVAGKVKGAQLAGVVNVADSISGVQGSGVINRARYVKGVQLGLINISDTCVGVPIGLVNIVKRGHNSFELYATETFAANIAFRSGTRALQWIYMVGVDPQTLDATPLYTFGLGLGTTFGKGKKLNYDLDLLAQQIASGPITDEINMLYRAGLGVDWKFSQKVSLFAGLTYNLYIVDSSTENYTNIFSKLPPFTLSNVEYSPNRNLKTWIGFKAGLRLY